MNKLAIENMELHLGLPLNSGYSFNIMFNLAERFKNITGSSNKITHLHLMYYIDIHGNFTSKNDLYSKIVNKIFTNLDHMLIMEVGSYIELADNNYEE